MKKWMYVTFPGVMLALFLVLYFAEEKKREAREKAHAAELARTKKDQDDKVSAQRVKADQEAKKRTADRQASDKKKEDERLAKWNKEGQEIDTEINRAKTSTDQSAKEIARMEAELAKLREARERGNREFLDALKAVELAQINRRTAELENERLLKIIDRRAGETPNRVIPPPPQKRSD